MLLALRVFRRMADREMSEGKNVAAQSWRQKNVEVRSLRRATAERKTLERE